MFVVPEFPLDCNIYPFFTTVLPAPRIVGADCNLAMGKRVQSYGVDRGSLGGCIGLPAGSNRWYLVDDVEPMGLGFPNWHVAAALIKMSSAIDGTFSAMVWPSPDPYVLANFP